MFERARSGGLFSVRRFAFTFGIALFVVLADTLVVQFFGVETVTGLITETAVIGLGSYVAYTIMAVFGTDVRL